MIVGYCVLRSVLIYLMHHESRRVTRSSSRPILRANYRTFRSGHE